MANRVTPAVTKHVTAIWDGLDALPALIDAAEAVERLQSSAGWAVLQQVLEAERHDLDVGLDFGPALTAEEYAKAHGRRSALAYPDEAARAIVEQAGKRRVRAEQQEREQRAGESAQRERVTA